MLSELIDTTGWTHEQWLAASIMAFIGVAVLVIAHRMYKIMRMTRKPRYQPNLSRLRRSSSYRTYLQQQDQQDNDEQAEDNSRN